MLLAEWNSAPQELLSGFKQNLFMFAETCHFKISCCIPIDGHTRRSPVFPLSSVLSVNTSEEIQAWSSTKEQNSLQIFGGFLQDS